MVVSQLVVIILVCMAAMEHISVCFTRPQLTWLRAEAKRLGISIAELLRRMIDTHRGEP
jgi:hypothetical protein